MVIFPSPMQMGRQFARVFGSSVVFERAFGRHQFWGDVERTVAALKIMTSNNLDIGEDKKILLCWNPNLRLLVVFQHPRTDDITPDRNIPDLELVGACTIDLHDCCHLIPMKTVWTNRTLDSGTLKEKNLTGGDIAIMLALAFLSGLTWGIIPGISARTGHHRVIEGVGATTEAIDAPEGRYCHQRYTKMNSPAVRMDINVFILLYVATQLVPHEIPFEGLKLNPNGLAHLKDGDYTSPMCEWSLYGASRTEGTICVGGGIESATCSSEW